MLYPSAPIPKAKTPPIVCATWLFAIWLAAASLAHGRAFEVLLLKGTEQNGVWGTEEFSLTVTSQGVVRHVKVRGQLLVWQAVSLYASPMPPGAKAGVRTVQGEPPGKTGLAMSLPKMSVRSDRGSRIFLLEHHLANPKVLGGKTLCDVTQRIVVTPTGGIETSYECHWLESLRWDNFAVLAIYDLDAVKSRNASIHTTDRLHTMQLLPGKGKPGDKRIFGQFEKLTIWTVSGPFHFTWNEPAQCAFRWGDSVQLHIRPPTVPRRKVIYKGQRDRFAYRILLPVSQQ